MQYRAVRGFSRLRKLKNEVQIEILQQIIKQTIIRIKSLQAQLIDEKRERKEMGAYGDCGDFYHAQVKQTETIISELISQKISFEKWRKKLKHENK